MIQLLGRATSGNVQKVLFLLEELGLPYERKKRISQEAWKSIVEQISYASRYALSRKQRSFCATAKYRGLLLCSGGE